MAQATVSDITVFYEATPNPQSLKFIATVPISPETANFTSAAEAKNSPLALKIFGFPWSAGVFLGPNFITVTKQEWVDWDILADPLAELIKEHLLRREPVLLEPAEEQHVPSGGTNPERPDPNAESETDSDTVKRIKQILRDEIRPAVAMDGGDITFHSFQEGRVYLRMHGACSGCPSATYTLKEGIETRIRAALPDVLEVVSV